MAMVDVFDWIAGGTVSALLIANLGFTWSLGRSIGNYRQETSKRLEDDRKETDTRLEALERAQATCRLTCNQLFATKEQVDRLQDRIEGALQEVKADLKRIIDRLLDQKR
jgi:hypothetical protein